MQRLAVVTGGASGIGRAIAEELAGSSQVEVIACDINEGLLAELEQQWRSDGKAIRARTLDVTDVAHGVRPLFDNIVREYGGIDILVNSAGLCSLTSIQDITEEEWDRIMAVNLKGTFFCCQAVIPSMVKRRYGRIVNISSAAGQGGGVVVGAHYSASKAGVICLTKTLARYLAPYGVTVNSVSPGTTDSNMTRSWPRESLQSVISSIPIGRLAQPSEIAKAVAFLASEAAGYITGHTLNVNGGMILS